MANRYWVGGTATWDTTAGTKWSATSGGAGGVSVPTSTDTVFFDGNSGSGSVTISGNQSIGNLNCTGFTGTLTHGPLILTINGSLTLSSGMTYTPPAATSQITLTGTGNQTITTTGKVLGTLSFNNASGNYTLQDALSLRSDASIILTSGTFNTNNYPVTAGVISSSNTNTRTLTLGSSVITLTGTTTVLNCDQGLNLTINAGTSSITLTGVGADIMLGNSSGTAKTLYDVAWTGGGSCMFLYGPGGVTCHNLSFTGTTSKVDVLLFQYARTLTVTNHLQLVSYSSLARVLISSNLQGSPAIINRSGATIEISNIDFKDITISGGNIDLSTVLSGDCGGNSGITFITATTQYWIAGAGNWSDQTHWSLTSGGTANGHIPLPQDDIVIDVNSGLSSGSRTILADMARLGYNITFSVSTITWSFGALSCSIFGSLTMFSGNLTINTYQLMFEGRGACTIDTAGVIINPPIIIAVYGTVTLLSAFATNGRQITISANCTFDTNNYSVTCSTFTANSTSTMLWRSSTINCTGTALVFNLGSGANINSGTSTINVSNTSATSKSMTPNGKTLFNLTFDGGSGIITLNSSMTVNNLSVTAPAAIKFTSGTTTTFNGTLNATGSLGNVIAIETTLAGSAATFSKLSGVVSCNYLSLKDIAATGGATWYAGADSTNVNGSSTGWIWETYIALTELISSDSINLIISDTSNTLVSFGTTDSISSISDGSTTLRVMFTILDSIQSAIIENLERIHNQLSNVDSLSCLDDYSDGIFTTFSTIDNIVSALDALSQVYSSILSMDKTVYVGESSGVYSSILSEDDISYSLFEAISKLKNSISGMEVVISPSDTFSSLNSGISRNDKIDPVQDRTEVIQNILSSSESVQSALELLFELQYNITQTDTINAAVVDDVVKLLSEVLRNIRTRKFTVDGSRKLFVVNPSTSITYYPNKPIVI